MILLLSSLLFLVPASYATHSNDDHNDVTSTQAEDIELIQYRTYRILYKDDNQPTNNALNCTEPASAAENLTSGEVSRVVWEAPSGITITTSEEEVDEFISLSPSAGSERDNLTKAMIKTEDQPNAAAAWVQLTSDHLLVFHNPDEVISGPYTCRGMDGDRLLFTNVVWVHVFRKYVFQTGERLKVGFISSAVFFLILVACYVGVWAFRRHKPTYKMTATREGVDGELHLQLRHDRRPHII